MKGKKRVTRPTLSQERELYTAMFGDESPCFCENDEPSLEELDSENGTIRALLEDAIDHRDREESAVLRRYLQENIVMRRMLAK